MVEQLQVCMQVHTSHTTTYIDINPYLSAGVLEHHSFRTGHVSLNIYNQIQIQYRILQRNRQCLELPLSPEDRLCHLQQQGEGFQGISENMKTMVNHIQCHVY